MINQRDEITALISLLDDPDSVVYNPVIDRLSDMGTPAIKILEKAWEKSTSTTIQVRIENVIQNIQQSALKKDMKDWVDCHGDQVIYGSYVLNRTMYPSLSVDELEEKINKIKAEIWLELNDRLTALEKIKVINHILFKVHGFNRSIKGIHSPQLYLMNHVIDTQKGLPVSLSILYCEIASRLDLPVYCVDLPRNFLLCYQDKTYQGDPDGILFYINPYTQGTVLGRAEVEKFLSDQNIEKRPEYFRPCSNIEAVQRLAEGLRYSYAASRMDDKAGFIDELIALMRSGNSF